MSLPPSQKRKFFSLQIFFSLALVFVCFVSFCWVTRSYYEAHAGLELMNLLHQALEYEEHRLGDCLALASFCQQVISSCDLSEAWCPCHCLELLVKSPTVSLENTYAWGNVKQHKTLRKLSYLNFNVGMIKNIHQELKGKLHNHREGLLK